MLETFFQDACEKDKKAMEALEQRSLRLSYLRGISFFAALFALAGGWDGRPALYVVGVLLLVAFALFVRRYRAIEREKRRLRAHEAAAESNLTRFSEAWRKLPVDGAGYLDEKRPQLADLHVFGPSSLYQYLCLARTKRGRDLLAASFRLTLPEGGAAALQERQQAIRELTARPELALDLEALSQLLPEDDDTEPLLRRLVASDTKVSAWRRAACWILPPLNVLSILAAAFSLAPWQLPGILLSVSFLITWASLRGSEDALSLLMPLAEKLPAYTEIFEGMEKAQVESPLLKRLQSSLRSEDGQPASQELRHLSRLAGWVGQRSNFFFYVLANALVLFDFQAGLAFRRWQKTFGSHLPQLLESYAELEVLFCYGLIPATRSGVCYPAFLPDDTPQFRAEALTNLLINEKTAVANDCDLQPSTTIETGSNMSGKTTWLRTLGMACVLAFSGAPVPARSCALSAFTLYTSIRVNDNLSEGISTFYAELLRIKTMVEAEKTGRPLFLLIDEIFKGTNSADRIKGAQAALTRLTNGHTITVASTHDFELCTLEVPGGTVRNIHFAEHYEDGKIAFDYKKRDGRCESTNAQYLLRAVGILD